MTSRQPYRKGRTASAAIAICAIPFALSIPMSAHATSGDVRYASPNGQGTTCSKAATCGIDTAINDAPDNSTVILEAGNYGSENAPMDQFLYIGGSNITVDGAGPLQTIIYTDASEVGSAVGVGGDNNTVEGIQIRDDGSESGGAIGMFSDTALVRDVIAYAVGATPACGPYGGTLSDSLCIAEYNDEPAVLVYDDQGPGESELTGLMRNVTAESIGQDGIGVYNEVTNPAVETLSVVNSIVHGTSVDVLASAVAGGTATVSITHSDLATMQQAGDGGAEDIGTNATDIKAVPKFVDSEAFNFREAAGSPTINRGQPDPASERTDLAGEPRILGGAPDMGAYEYLEKPVVKHLTIIGRGAHNVHLKLSLNPEGLPTTVKVVAVHHGHRTTHAMPGRFGADGTSTHHFTIRGLHAHTTYRIYLVASNSGGTARSPRRTVTTKH